MGEGIARVCLQAGLDVRLHDVDSPRVARIVRELAFPPRRLRAVNSCGEFSGTDLVIEAIPEDLPLKRRWLMDVEPTLPPSIVVATNTSSLPLASLAPSLRHPERFCGLHFCHPVTQRPLLEVVRGMHTSTDALSSASTFARDIGKTPIIVGDSPGFVLNRLLSLYLTEALELLLEGTEHRVQDEVAAGLGMPLGPLQQLDAFGLELALSVGRQLWKAFPDRWLPSELLIALCKAERRNEFGNCGLYADTEPDDPANQSRCLHPRAAQILQERQRRLSQLTRLEVERRLWLPLLLEATRILEAGLVRRWAEIDQILELGLGMQPGGFRLELRAAIGEQQLLQWLKPLRSLGGRFVPGPDFGHWLAVTQSDNADGSTRRAAA